MTLNHRMHGMTVGGNSPVVPSKEKLIKKGARLKLLQFHRNYRPAFYGTFRKRVKITGRSPYRKDGNCFDYEFDSGLFTHDNTFQK